MKILGYIDDVMTWFFNWQINMKWWNLIIIPIEFIIIQFFLLRFRTHTFGN